MIYADMDYRVNGYEGQWRLRECRDGIGILRGVEGNTFSGDLAVRMDQKTYNRLYSEKGRMIQYPTVLEVLEEIPTQDR